MKTNCPKCSSEQTQSFKIVHLNGTSHGNVMVSTFSEGGGFGVAGGPTRSQTSLALMAAPPRQDGSFAVAMITVLLSVVVGVFALGILSIWSVIAGLIVGIGIAIAGTIAADRVYKRDLPKKEAVYKAKLKRWEASWACLQCGNTFQVR